MAGIEYLEMKTHRAEEQLDELDRRIGEFVKDAYTITRKDYSQKERHVVRLELKPMPYQIAMLVGEFAYSLRSGLDQLAWQLALLNTKPKRPRSATSFPIRSVAPLPPKGFGDCMKDILPAAATVIASLQPYHRGKDFTGHPLYLLNELCIIDKHQTLAVHSNAASIRISGADYSRRRELDYGFEVFFDLRDKFKIQLDPIQTELILGEPINSPGSGGFEVRIATLRTIYDFVRNEVSPRFAGFFKASSGLFER
jgi:hypothetical protein